MNYDPESSVLVSSVDVPLVDLAPEIVKPPPGSIMLKIPALSTPPSLKRVRLEGPLEVEEDSPTKKKKHIRFATP